MFAYVHPGIPKSDAGFWLGLGVFVILGLVVLLFGGKTK
jgi:hypothetical protein